MRTALVESSWTVLIAERNYCMHHARKRTAPAPLPQWNCPSLKIPGVRARGFLFPQPGHESLPVEVTAAEHDRGRAFDRGIGQQRGHGGGAGGPGGEVAPQHGAVAPRR